MTLLSLLEQLYDMPQRVPYSQFIKVRQDIRNHPDYYTIKDEFEQSYTEKPGWIFCGADFSSLEDRINALLTKDINKLKVYMGHEVYEVTIGSNTHHIRDDDTINFDGKTYTGKEFYDTYCKL